MNMEIRATVAPVINRSRRRLDLTSTPDFSEETSHGCHAVSPRFPGRLVGDWRCKRPWPRPSLASEPPPEVTTIRVRKSAVICFAPLYVVEAFARAEGFTDVQFVTSGYGVAEVKLVEQGDLDFGVNFAGTVVHELDAGLRLTALGGLHVGCFELFAREPIRTISDLKGRRVGITALHAGNLYLSIMTTHVGLDPKWDIEWVASTDRSALEVFADGEADAFLGFPPEPQMLRDRGYDRVILNTLLDYPWSQYFCCMIYANRAWVHDHPIATKRFLRAMYKAAEFCTAAPERAAAQLVDGSFAERHGYALETIETVPYDLWHEYDPADTLRFFALRLHEGGMLKSNPNALLAEGADWRFLSDLKRELKA